MPIGFSYPKRRPPPTTPQYPPGTYVPATGSTMEPAKAQMAAAPEADPYALKGPSAWYQPRYYRDLTLSFWENPQRLVRYRQVMQARQQEGGVLPEWYNQDVFDQAYTQLEQQNRGRGWWNWDPLPYDDPTNQELVNWPAPPKELLWPKEQKFSDASYTPAEPSAMAQPGQEGMTPEQWSETPLWKRLMLGIMSSPLTTAAMTALPGFAIGAAVGGLPGGAIGGVVGAGLGAYSHTNPESSVAELLMKLDYPRELLEQAFGIGAQMYGSLKDPGKYGALSDVLANLEAARRAATLTYTAGGAPMTGEPLNLMAMTEPALRSGVLMAASAAALLGRPDLASEWAGNLPTAPEWQLAQRSQVYSFAPGVLVEEAPFSGDVLALLANARDRIVNGGESPDEVINEYTLQYGLSGAFRELASGFILDPLNFIHLVTQPIGSRLAGGAGNLQLANAFRTSHGLVETVRLYGRLLRTAPMAEVSKMDSFSRWLGLVTKEGTSQALAKSPGGVLGWMFSLRPQDRAAEATNLGVVNLVTMLDRTGDDPVAMVKNVQALSRTPDAVARSLSMSALGSSDAAALPLALRDFDETSNAMLVLWQATRKQAGAIEGIAALLGVKPEEVFVRLRTPASADILLRSVVDKARLTGEAGAGIVAAYEAGRNPVGSPMPVAEHLTADNLRKWVKMFAEENVPFDTGMFKGQLFAAAGEHVAKWAADWFGVKPDPGWVRLSQTVKSAQSALLLGLNPNYLINNFLNNILTMAVEGVLGFRTQADIDRFWNDFGVIPPRLHAGIGPEALGSEIDYRAIRKATAVPGILSDVQQFMNTKIRKFEIFSNLSVQQERWASAQALTAGTKQAWARLWRKNVGFNAMPAHLEKALAALHPALPSLVYGAISGSMNKAGIERALFEGFSRITVDSVLPELSRAMNKSETEVAELLHQSGIYDELTNRMQGAKTNEDVRRAIQDVNSLANDRMIERMRREISDSSAQAAARVSNEGAQAVVDLHDANQVRLLDTTWAVRKLWDDAFIAADEIRAMGGSPRPIFERVEAEVNNLWDIHQARNAATYLGMVAGLGVDNQYSRTMLDLVGKFDDNWMTYRLADQELKRVFYGAPTDTPEERQIAFDTLESDRNELYALHSSQELNLQRTLDEQFAQLMEGEQPGAGNVTRRWRRAVMDIREIAVQEIRAFTDSLRGQPAEVRRREWTNFLHGVDGWNARNQQRFQAERAGVEQWFRDITGQEPPPSAAGEPPPQPPPPQGVPPQPPPPQGVPAAEIMGEPPLAPAEPFVAPLVEPNAEPRWTAVPPAEETPLPEGGRRVIQPTGEVWDYTPSPGRKIVNLAVSDFKIENPVPRHIQNIIQSTVYGGSPDLTLDTITPEQARAIFSKREEIKDWQARNPRAQTGEIAPVPETDASLTDWLAGKLSVEEAQAFKTPLEEAYYTRSLAESGLPETIIQELKGQFSMMDDLLGAQRGGLVFEGAEVVGSYGSGYEAWYAGVGGSKAYYKGLKGKAAIHAAIATLLAGTDDPKVSLIKSLKYYAIEELASRVPDVLPILGREYPYHAWSNRLYHIGRALNDPFVSISPGEIEQIIGFDLLRLMTDLPTDAPQEYVDRALAMQDVAAAKLAWAQEHPEALNEMVARSQGQELAPAVETTLGPTPEQMAPEYPPPPPGARDITNLSPDQVELLRQVMERESILRRAAQAERYIQRPALLGAGDQRQMLRDISTRLFNYTDEQADDYMLLMDARASLFAKDTDLTPEDYYRMTFAGGALADAGSDPALYQENWDVREFSYERPMRMAAERLKVLAQAAAERRPGINADALFEAMTSTTVAPDVPRDLFNTFSGDILLDYQATIQEYNFYKQALRRFLGKEPPRASTITYPLPSERTALVSGDYYLKNWKLVEPSKWVSPHGRYTLELEGTYGKTTLYPSTPWKLTFPDGHFSRFSHEEHAKRIAWVNAAYTPYLYQRALVNLDMVHRARVVLGTTSDLLKTGFVDAEGQMLDLSAGGNRRSTAHGWAAEQVLGDDAIRYSAGGVNYHETLLRFMSETGAARVAYSNFDTTTRHLDFQLHVVDRLIPAQVDAFIADASRRGAATFTLAYEVSSTGEWGVMRDLDEIGQLGTKLEQVGHGPGRETGRNTFYQMAPNEPGPVWYHVIQRVVEKWPNERGSADSLATWVRKQTRGEEIKWSRLDEWLDGRKGQKVTKAEVLDYLRGEGQVRFGMTLMYDIGDMRDITLGTNYREQSLPGALNYREMVFAFPADNRFQFRYQQKHFRQFENVFAHVRFDDRIDVESKQVLFIEELQSDWHQEGREKGYIPQGEIETLQARQSEITKRLEELEYTRLRGNAEAQAEFDALVSERNRISSILESVPSAPFAETWPMLVMQRMLRWATENGYDRVAWTPGKVQADRYKLSQYIGELAYWKDGENTWGVSLLDDRLNPIESWQPRDLLTPKELVDNLGKDVANRIVNDQGYGQSIGGFPEDRNVRYLSGEELSVGGQGMYEFYDRQMVNSMNKYAKKWGTQVREIDIETLPGQFETVHSIDITSEMRQSVLAGQPMLFQSGLPRAAVSFTDEGKAILAAFQGRTNVTSLVHETGHIFLEDLLRTADLANDPARRLQLAADIDTTARWAGLDNGSDFARLKPVFDQYRRLVAEGNGDSQYAREIQADALRYETAHEAFATAFERYLYDGKAPLEALRRVFENFKRWLMSIYASLKDSPIERNLDDGIRNVFDRLFDAEAGRPPDEVVPPGPQVKLPPERPARPIETTRAGQIQMFGAEEELPLFTGTPMQGQEAPFRPAGGPPQPVMPGFEEAYRPPMAGAIPGGTTEGAGPMFGAPEAPMITPPEAAAPTLTPPEAPAAIAGNVVPARVAQEEQLFASLVGQFRNLSPLANFMAEREFEAFISRFGFDINNELDLNLAYDLLEGAMNVLAREERVRIAGLPLAEQLMALGTLENRLARSRRTLAKMKLQQFSTPLPIAEAAGVAADLRPGDVLGEPTAGTANLVDKFSGRRDVTIKVNEIDENRRRVLRLLGYDPTGVDVMTGDWVVEGGKALGPYANVQIINPPWGAYTTGKYGRPINDPVTMNDWSQRFTYLILRRTAEGGRIAGVMPTNWVYTMDRATKAITPKESAFLTWLKHNYAVKALIESPPDAYKSRGTGVASLLVVFDKSAPDPTARVVEAWGDNAPADWAEYAHLVEQVPKRTEGDIRRGQQTLNSIPVARPEDTGIIDPAATRGEARGDPRNIGQPAGLDAERAGRPGGPGGPGAELPARPAPELEGRNVEQPPRAGGGAAAGMVEGQPERVRGEAKPVSYSAEFEQRRATGRAAVKDSRSFTEYVGRAPLRPEDVAHLHPNIIVETKGLAGVPYPQLEDAYRPTDGVMRAMNRRVISLEGNVDPIWAAIQQNDKHHRGILIADDVGIGKSRTAAGFVIDRIQRGKKKILVITKGRQNVENLMNSEFPGTWAATGNENGAFGPIPDEFPARRVYVNGESMPAVKKGTEPIPTFDEPTVYFMTHTEFANFEGALTRLAPDVIVVDEAHEFRNLDTNRAAAWYHLHEDWIRRSVDFMYMTATPGTDVMDLQYLYGLRNWTLDGFGDWISVITGEQSPEQAARRAEAEVRISSWLGSIRQARDQISTKAVTRQSWMEGGDYQAVRVEDRLDVWRSKHYSHQGKYIIASSDSIYPISMAFDSETEAIIVADIAIRNTQPGREINQSELIGAQGDYRNRFHQPERTDLQAVDMRDASDIIVKSDRNQWGNGRRSPFEMTLSPAHTEQIMRELKASGSYMSRDISRANVIFGVKEYTPPPAAIVAFDRRVEVYRDVYMAWSRFGRMNEGPKKTSALYGVNGDIQGDAKRALFNMRLPGVIAEADRAIAAGQRVVISVVSVGEVNADEERGYLWNAVSKINTQEVHKVGQGQFSDPNEIPEAMIAIAELGENIRALDELPSPIDVLKEKYAGRIAFITGATSASDRAKATRDFQNENVDVILISGAGKTGINLHDITGTRGWTDERGIKHGVHLIVADYEWSATTFKQELGRVDRTGQTTSPEITVMHTGSAAERKFVATIANRMKGLGATSKGGAESTGTAALTDEFELGSTIDKIAMQDTWRDLDPRQREMFLDRAFKDEHLPDYPRAALDATAQMLKKFLLALQAMPIKVANDIYDLFAQKRLAIMDSDAAQADAAQRAAMYSGQISRTTELRPNLSLHEVVNEENHRFGVISGILTPHMNGIRTSLIGNILIDDPTTRNAWMRWVQFYDPEQGGYVSGLQVPKGRMQAVAEYYGQMLGVTHTPATALDDIMAGDRIPVIGHNMKAWELYLGRAGAREGQIVIQGATMADREPLMRNGAVYQARGGFFALPPENIGKFFERFQIQEQAPGSAQHFQRTWFPTENGPRRLLYQRGDGANVVQGPDGTPQAHPPEQPGPPPAASAPLGSTDSLLQQPPVGETEAEAWLTNLRPVLGEIERRLTSPDALMPAGRGDLRNISPTDMRELRQWLGQVEGQRADTKLAAIRIGESKRDMSLLNYGHRYGFDNLLQAVWPYSFWYTRTALNWLFRAIDRPVWLANYARIREFQRDVQRTPGFPKRLEGKIRIPFPFLPGGMGGSIYVDPMRQIFPFEQITRPWEKLREQRNQETQRALSILQQQEEDGDITTQEAQAAAATRQGSTWDAAYSQAALEVEGDISSAWDFASLIAGPSLPLQWAINMAGVKIPGLVSGSPQKIGRLPLTRGWESLTAALGINEGRGLNLEGPLRRALSAAGIPEKDRFTDYNVERELSNMAAEGQITSDVAEQAMMEHSGEAWGMAEKRVAQQGIVKYAGAPLGADLFPEGEQEQRALKVEYDRARVAWQNGNKEALNDFFDRYPEYETRLALFRSDPTERLRRFLISNIWEGYLALPDLRQQELAEQAEGFSQSFLDKETRNYDNIDTPTLVQWAQALGVKTPQTAPEVPALAVDRAPEQVVQSYQAYQDEKDQMFPNLSDIMDRTYSLPEGDPQRVAYERRYQPVLDRYYRWKDQQLAAHPELIEYLQSDDSRLAYAPPEIQTLYYQFSSMRDVGFPGIFDIQDQYYDQPEGAKRTAFKKSHPELVAYWSWRREFLAQFPGLIPYVVSEDTLAKAYLGESYMAPNLDLGKYPAALSSAMMRYMLMGQPLGSGARALLRSEWQAQGSPRGNFDAWLGSFRP